MSRTDRPEAVSRSRSDSDEPRIDDESSLDVSIVIPVYNDPQGIRATLDALVSQSFSAERYEIVVVDNGSTDHTRMVVREYCELFDAVRLVVEDEVQGSYAARNRGIHETTAPVIAFVDADMIVGPRWVEQIARKMATTDVEYLACDVELFTPGSEGIVAKYNRLNDLHVQRFVEELSFAPTCCLVVRRTLFEQLGTFDPRLRSGGDFEFGNRVAAADRNLTYCPELTMYHPTRTSVSALLSKAERVGRGKTQLRRHHPDRYGSPLLYALNPRAYLPPKPSFLERSIRTWASLTRSEKFVFFVLTYVTSLVKAYGQLVELAAPTENGASSG